MQTNTIYIGSDHAGYELKQSLIAHLTDLNYHVEDLGTSGKDSCDYPDFAHPVAQKVSETAEGKGILICGSANGVAITANKHKGIRAAIAWKTELAELARQHNNANVLCLPARYLTNTDAMSCVNAFLNTPFEGGRHQNRINKIDLP